MEDNGAVRTAIDPTRQTSLASSGRDLREGLVSGSGRLL